MKHKHFIECPTITLINVFFFFFLPFSIFSAGLPVSRCVTSQDTNIVYGTVRFIGVVINFICLKKFFCVKNGVEIFHILPECGIKQK